MTESDGGGGRGSNARVGSPVDPREEDGADATMYGIKKDVVKDKIWGLFRYAIRKPASAVGGDARWARGFESLGLDEEQLGWNGGRFTTREGL